MRVAEPEPFTRRDPDALLEACEAVERSKTGGLLKIFLGYAPGVGKSFRLFDEGRRRHSRGEDVVIGAMHSGVSDEVATLVAALERIPARAAGGTESLDLAAILARHPAVCLVDGVAYDNPPGSANAKRYDDVRALVEAGVSVLTTVSLEHIAEQQPFVRETVGQVPSETVPQSFVEGADEVVVVDVPPGSSADRSVLEALRQRALLLMAAVVDRQLEDYLRRHGLRPSWATQERVLVCMTPRANAARMLAAARRTVDHFHGELYAIYVLQANLTDEDRMANERNATLALAQQAYLGVLEGDDPVATIMEFAQRHAVTQLFVGHTQQRGWRARFGRTPLERLIREAHQMDVRVFPQ